MASEEAGERASFAVPGELASWLERGAAERDVDPDVHLADLLAAQRAVATGGVDDAPPADELVTEALLERRIDALEREHAELLEDVRERVIQVKRETDAKAPADHGHEEFAALAERVEALADELEAHAEEVAAVRDDLDDGFEHYESTLEDLLATTEDLSERADRLGRAVVSLREDLDDVAGAVREREAADRLKRDAALEGVETAACEDCGHDVRAALLTAPRCPACQATFAGLEPKRGLLGSATFVTGDDPPLAPGAPASDGPETDSTGSPDEAAATGRPDGGAERAADDGERARPGDVDWASVGDGS